jgi:hypothetical protein
MKPINPFTANLIKKAAKKTLTKEERDENLKKFLEPSAVQMRLYHGTTATEGGKGQEAIRQFKPSKEGALGSGVYMTPKADYAGYYAVITPYGAPPSTGGNVLPVYAQMRNPLVINGEGDPMIEALIKLGLDENKASRIVERAYENKGYIGKEVESRARAAGYDGLMQYRDGELAEVVSYNPSAIKSALGNEGTYDTSTPLLNKAEGGLIRMQGGGKPPPGIKRATDRAKESKSVLPVAGARQARQAIQGYLGMDPSFSVMDPEAQALESAYRGGETASVLGDLVASLTPFAAASAAAKANQVPGLAELIAYHGSPHKFKKFDASKIGTGEGAQAYGHGLYFAENPKVAKEYAINLANRDLANQGRLNAHANAKRLATLAGDPKYAADDIRSVLELNPKHEQAGLLKATLEMLESGDYAKPLKTQGSLYTVDIPDEKIAQMLDWDKPLSQQPKAVQEFAKSKDPNLASKEPHFLAPSGEIFHWTELLENVDQLKDKKMREMSPKIFGGGEWVDYGDYLLSRTTGGDFYRSLSAPSEWSKQASIGAGRTGFDDVETSALLREAGIPGIQYLDQASRDAKQGTRNFVVFPGEEQSIKMLDIDGVPQKADGGLIRMQDGGDPTQMFNFNPMAAKAAKQKQMRESTPETPLGAFSRGFATGLFGSTEEQVPYTGSIMEGSPQRQQSQANLREIGRNVGALTDIGGMVTPFVKPATQAVTRGATALGRTGLEQVDRAMFGEGPLGNALSMVAPLNVNAPVSKLGFYNPIEEMATTLQRKQGPGQAFLNEFTKAGISKQRLEDAGLAQKLAAAPNVTREEVQAMTKGTMPDVEEVVLSRSVIPPYMKGFANLHMPNLDVNDYRQINQLRKIADERYKKALAENDLDAAEFAMKAEEDINKFSRTHSYGTKPGDRLTEFHEYQEPGGKNYREILLKVPVKRVSEEEARVILNARPEDKLSVYDIDFASRKANPAFVSTHWMDPNVISHIRMNDRVDADNKNVLFIEELQSDWAQEGRKKGFAGKPLTKDDLVATVNNSADRPYWEVRTKDGHFIANTGLGDKEINAQEAVDEALQLVQTRGDKRTPAGPFVKNTNEWVDLSLKNIIRRAVDEGYDRVAFIDGYKSFLRFPQDAKGESTEAGMRKFYDEIIPSRLKALVGKDNVRTIPGITQQRPLDVSLQGDRYYVVDADTDIAIPDHPGFRSLERAEQYLDELYSKTKSMDQIGFDITPEIREKFSQPIPYKHGGVVKMAAGGAKKLKRASEAIAKFQDPQATKIQEWQWRPLAEVNKQLNLAEVPDYIQRGYGDFMIEQGKRAAAGNLGVRDLIKAYGITQSSIGRGGLSYDTATKAGLKVPKTEGLVRPEGAFAEWLGSKQGQKFLDDAERGVVNEKALDDIRAKFAPFGKANQLTEQLRYGVNNMSTLVPQMQQALVGSADEYRDWAESIKGIAGAKSGFIGSMLGRGDLPTLDARQLNLHSLDSPVAPQTMMQRGKGLGAREAVDRLAARQSALGLDIDPSLDPYYQHLAHHAVWDKVADEKTTHEDLMRALRGYKEGGEPDTDAMRLEMMRKSWRSK